MPSRAPEPLFLYVGFSIGAAVLKRTLAEKRLTGYRQ